MRILIVGAGAVGGYFGARLAQAWRDVTFLVRPNRGAQLRREGLHVASPHGNIAITPRLLEAGQIEGPFDLILLSVKAFALQAAIEDFAPAVGPSTMILPLLNGMHHLDVLIARFGSEPVLGGLCVVSTEVDDDGRIRQLTDFQSMTYGERAREVSPRIESLHATLQGAGFETVLSQDIVQAMWDKWVMLASLAAATCLLDGPVGHIVEQKGGVDLMHIMVAECRSIAAACGHPPSQAFMTMLLARLTEPGSQFTSSMSRDMRRGQAVEVDQILGDLLDRGVEKNVSAPLLRAAYVKLRIYETQRPKAA